MPKGDSIEAEVRSAIMSGELVPASRLRMEDLRARFEVGFSPIREALSRLVGEGLVELEPNKGFRVRALDRSDLYDIAVTRCAVEVAALRRSMEVGGDEWEQAIVGAMHGYRKKSLCAFDTQDTLLAWEKAHDALHFALISACGSPRLMAMQRRLQDQHLRYRRLIVLPQVEHHAHEEEHEQLVATVLDRRIDDALALIERHMMITVEALDQSDFWEKSATNAA